MVLPSGQAVRIDGLQETKRMLAKLEQKARRRVVTSAVRAGNREVIKTARAEAPVDTGTLKRQIRQTIKMDRMRGIVRGTVKPKRTKSQRKKGQGAQGRVLHIIVGGARPHVIRPKKANALAFGGGAVKEVQHPGHKGNPFMDRAFRVSHARATRAFSKAFREKMDSEIQKARVTI